MSVLDLSAWQLALALLLVVAVLAIRYQIVVVFMQAAATAIGSLLFVRLAAGRYLTAAHQLRRYLL